MGATNNLGQPVSIDLTDEQWNSLEAQWPFSEGSAAAGCRAEALADIYLRAAYPGCEFVDPDPGADLAILCKKGVRRNFDVKGTRSKEMAWHQIKVSSLPTHNLLVGGMPILRILDVYGKRPVVHELTISDFELVVEPRWAVKRRR